MRSCFRSWSDVPKTPTPEAEPNFELGLRSRDEATQPSPESIHASRIHEGEHLVQTMPLRNRQGRVTPIILNIVARARLQQEESTFLVPVLARRVESCNALDA